MKMFPNCVNAKSIKKPAKKYLSGIWSWGGRSISGGRAVFLKGIKKESSNSFQLCDDGMTPQ
ncbi:hypothetical protein [Pseudomonas silesiensis]|jgi:hypothetical protein|uniref:hypothetical protein n=1 Tax=Pseudomonas silesiensis TaxID=1853130 RepID=UPI0030DC4AF6